MPVLRQRWYRPLQHAWSKRRALWLALLAGALMAVAVAALRQSLNERAREHIGAATGYAGHTIELLIREDMAQRRAALARLAQRWTATGGMPRPLWEADAASYVADMPGVQAIEWADTDMRVRWIYPLAGNEAARGLHISPTHPARAAADAARASGTATVSQPFELAKGGPGIVAFAPVMRNGSFDGLVIIVVRLQAWLEQIFNRLQFEEHDARIFLTGQEVYHHHPPGEAAAARWQNPRAFTVQGLTWAAAVTPKREFVADIYTRRANLGLVVGLLLSLLVAAAVYLTVTARLRAFQLHDTASRLAGVFQNLPGMAYRCINKPSWPMEFVSEGCEHLSGYRRRDFETQRIFWGELIHPEDRPPIWQKVQRAIDARESFEIEYRIVTRENEERWMWERGRAVSVAADNGIHIEGIINDITDRKRAELALEEARAFSEAVVDTAAEAVITIDAGGAIETFNRAAQQMFGYSAQEIRGRNVRELMPDPYRGEHDHYMADYLTTGQPRMIGRDRDVEARRADGTVFPISLSVSELPHPPHHRFVGLIRDISRQRAAELEAREHRAQLAHVDRLNMLGEMATGIAHEINQPLTAISLFAQAGKRLFESGERDQVVDIFDKLSQHAQRAGNVIERMLTLARRGESAKEITDCNTLVTEVAKLAEVDARLMNITIEVNTGEGLPLVAVDAVQIQQVALNLLRNGMEAMRSTDCRHGRTIRLQTQPGADSGVQVAVVDSGCGVSKQAAEKIFSPFSTTKDSGLGLGLSICQAIISAHGGQLGFYNNTAAGATFFFSLPPANSSSTLQEA
ncbi:PAS domain S-box protein [Exilibacterium tricleocarpae]|uniref:Sensor protein FixL n=1 Tax=Exilibacterium tricleocarpae TaxID=2591008 RepID=A0A545TVA4_9GAMM|nr:PAS domain S-box protein [Exilibacterium tricleocarpae]TQV81149.1 PAS domain S-box protein [Exilibacterium tricleocarpae]